MDRRSFLTLATTLSGIGRIGCAHRPKLHRLRISANPYFSMSGLYLAQEAGYFAGQGLEVDVQLIATAPQAIALAAGGALDIVFTSASAALVNAISKGARPRIVAAREIAAPACSDIGTLYGRRAAFPNGLQDLKILEGKRIASNLDTGLGGFAVDMILASAGLTPEALRVLNMRRSESVPALLAGRIDAVFLSDFVGRYLQISDKIVRGITLADVLPNHQVSFILFGATLLGRDLEIGRRFLSAFRRGTAEYVAGRTPRFHDELAVSSGMDPNVVRSMCRNSFVPDGRIDLPSLERFIQWAVRKGFCPVPVQAEQLVDMRFLENLKESAS